MAPVPGRNDPCWCGSGRKFKKCHLLRDFQKPLPPEAVLSQIRQKLPPKRCFHPLASPEACRKVAESHTVSRLATLRSISDSSGHVLTFYPLRRDDRGELIIRRVGWREASTFPGFCETHDGLLFAPLEQQPFTGTPEQCFLLAYRALSHELYQKESVLSGYGTIRDLVDRGRSPEEQFPAQEHIALFHSGVARAIGELRRYKADFDQRVLRQDFAKWTHLITTFSGNLAVAGTGAPTPDRDLDGAVLQVLHDPKTDIQPVFFSVIGTPEGGAIVVSGLREHTAAQRFISGLVNFDRRLLPALLVQFLFFMVENVFFSDKWWSSMSERDRRQIRMLAAETNPYYSPRKFLPEVSLPWMDVSTAVSES